MCSSNNVVALPMPSWYIDTCFRLVNGLLGDRCDVSIIDECVVINPNPGVVINVDTWIDYLMSVLSGVNKWLKDKHVSQRNSERCYSHVISSEEFILLLKCNGEQHYLDLTKTFDEHRPQDSNNSYENLLLVLEGKVTKDTFDHNINVNININIMVKSIFSVCLPMETGYIRRRDAVNDNVDCDIGFIRGDIVSHEFITSDTNDSIYIYDGQQLVNLVPSPIHSSSGVPHTFPVITQFPIMYWSDSISNNNLVFVHIPVVHIPVVHMPVDHKDVNHKHVNYGNVNYDYQRRTNESCDLAIDVLIEEGKIGHEPPSTNAKIAVSTMVANTVNHNNHTSCHQQVNYNYIVIFYDNIIKLTELLDQITNYGTYLNYITEDCVYVDICNYHHEL